MILTDTGAIVALNNDADPDHSRCMEVLERMPSSQRLITTWPCVTESMHFLGRSGGYAYQSRIWEWVNDGRLILHEPIPAEVTRMEQLMERYSDTPMDLADASLIAAAETLRMRQVFTIDTDFYVYRLSDGSALEVIPQPGPNLVR